MQSSESCSSPTKTKIPLKTANALRLGPGRSLSLRKISQSGGKSEQPRPYLKPRMTAKQTLCFEMNSMEDTNNKLCFAKFT